MFEIEVKKVTRQEVPDKSWNRVADTGNPRDNGACYEYVETTKIEENSMLILSQTVEELDLSAVINAINKIP